MKQNLALLAVSILFCLLMFAAVDYVLWRIYVQRHPLGTARELHISGLEPDAMLGYRLRPNLSLVDTKTVNDTHVFSAEYHTDDVGRRIVPINESREDAEAFIAFFGCSFTFGTGLADEDTLPNQAGAYFPQCRVYNYGAPGFGTQHMLAQLQTGKVRNEIPLRSGVAVYVMIPSHVGRAVGSALVLTSWGRDFPCYRLDQQGGLRHLGAFAQLQPGWISFMHYVRKSGFVRYFDLDFPVIRAAHLNLTGKIITESKRIFEEQFDSRGFYVLLFPTFLEKGIDLDPLIEQIKAQGVGVLDYRGTPLDRNLHILHPRYDEHPNAALHRIISEKIAQDIVFE